MAMCSVYCLRRLCLLHKVEILRLSLYHHHRPMRLLCRSLSYLNSLHQHHHQLMKLSKRLMPRR
jgi:hypothetical protein